MQVPAHLFRAYDIRGIAPTELTPAVAHAVGRAVTAEYPKAQHIALGRDGRHTSLELAEALADGLIAGGVTVHDIGQVPTPILYFATHHLKLGSGIMVTGSHNPPEYNGFKLMLQGHTLVGPEVQALYHRIQKRLPNPGGGRKVTTSVEDAYCARIAEDVVLDRPLRVALDAGNSVAGPIASQVLQACGASVTELYCTVDGDFPNHHPNPSDPANLKDLQARVVADSLDLGLALDGDGDRCGIVDDQGDILWPDRQLMLHAADVLEREPGATVVFDVKCSGQLPNVIQSHGGQAVMVRTGHSFIKASLRETGAALAGEMSGHLFFRERWYGFDDGIYAGARMLEILARQAKTAHALFAELPKTYATPELNVPFARFGEQHKFIEKFSARACFPTAELTRIDGLRADFADGFGLARASNTAPYMVMRFEGTTETAMKRIQESFREQILAVDPNLDLPF